MIIGADLPVWCTEDHTDTSFEVRFPHTLGSKIYMVKYLSPWDSNFPSPVPSATMSEQS